MAGISLATLLKLVAPGGLILRYQNFQPTPIIFNSENYEFAGFEVQNYPDVDLSLGTEDIKIAIRNTQFLKSLLRQYNDFKKSIVLLQLIQPGTSVPPIGFKLINSFTSYEDSSILFTLRNPTSALTGRVCTRYISTADFPELPYYRPQL